MQVVRARDRQRGVVLEDAALKLLQLAARFEPELVAQPRTRRSVCLERCRPQR